MKKITLDKCEGLKNIRVSGSNEHPIIEPGMYVVLSQSKTEIKVEVGPKIVGHEQSNFTGKVITGIDTTTPPLNIGDNIPFLRENICHITKE
ncbi:MAG TPA: hypothetical protein DCG34_10545 [Clostridiales bacterium]|jgi:hypothetical protein|nr:hypothetical protein [Clostridiales bacterium]